MLFNMDRLQVPQQMVMEVGDTFRRILEEKVRDEHASKFLILLPSLGFLLSEVIVFPWVVGEKCWQVQDLNGKLRLLQKDLTSIVDGKVSSSILFYSTWEISKVQIVQTSNRGGFNLGMASANSRIADKWGSLFDHSLSYLEESLSLTMDRLAI